MTRLAKSKYPTGEGLYAINAKIERNTHKAMLVEGEEGPNWDEWHRRFGHVAISSLRK